MFQLVALSPSIFLPCVFYLYQFVYGPFLTSQSGHLTDCLTVCPQVVDITQDLEDIYGILDPVSAEMLLTEVGLVDSSK